MSFAFPQNAFSIQDLNNALILARLSALAYKNPTSIEIEAPKILGGVKTRFIESGETQCFLAAQKDGLILAFRGTEQNKLRDWLTDIDTDKVRGPWGRVHRGFSEALDEVWGEVSSALKDLQSSRLQPLWVTGHSLGGALAVVASAKLHASGRRVKGLYTFGQPRVGDRDFCTAFDERITNAVRFVNNEDIVARVPKFKYEDIGDKCYFDRNRKALWNPSKMETWIDCLNEIDFRSLDVENRFLSKHPNCIGDHAIDRYIAAIQNNMPPSGQSRPYADFLNYVNRT